MHREQIETPWVVTEIQPVGLHALVIAPGGSANAVLHGPTFSASLARWSLVYDYLVLDGPSVLTSADTSIIQDSVDAVVLWHGRVWRVTAPFGTHSTSCPRIQWPGWSSWTVAHIRVAAPRPAGWAVRNAAHRWPDTTGRRRTSPRPSGQRDQQGSKHARQEDL